MEKTEAEENKRNSHQSTSSEFENSSSPAPTGLPETKNKASNPLTSTWTQNFEWIGSSPLQTQPCPANASRSVFPSQQSIKKTIKSINLTHQNQIVGSFLRVGAKRKQGAVVFLRKKFQRVCVFERKQLVLSSQRLRVWLDQF